MKRQHAARNVIGRTGLLRKPKSGAGAIGAQRLLHTGSY